ncbi:MAG: thioester domain-containing protein, partial [Arachnia propionica]|uniref:thioester domain-containing protein n=1 Tax=Arachnia propionica TaxID=1750 RepID=UPI0026FEA75F|nr:thioester domain-containing protein [Arachnia propionica]
MRTPNRAVPRYVLAAMMAAAMLFSALVSPQARADEYDPGYPKLGTSQELYYGHYLDRDGKPYSTQLLAVHAKAGAKPFYAYCVELDVPARWGTDLQQVGWDQFPGTNNFKTDANVRAKVSWIVQRSYPQSSLEEITKAADVPGLTEKEAVTATQSAIWNLTNGFKWNGKLWDHYGQAPDTDAARQQRVKKLYDYLLGPANTGLQESAGPALTIKAPEQAGEAGAKVGPILIESTAATVKLEGELPYPLVTADGKAVDANAAPVGQELFLDVPADAPAGEVKLTSSLFGHANAGQLLIGKGKRTQTIILVHSTPKKVDAEVKLMWNAKPTPPAPSTPAPSTPAPTTPTPRQPAPRSPAHTAPAPTSPSTP